MNFKLTLKSDNAAFDTSPDLQVAAILKNVAKRLTKDGPSRSYGELRDTNGNVVGSYTFDPGIG